jgi:hypothetical protein
MSPVSGTNDLVASNSPTGLRNENRDLLEALLIKYRQQQLNNLNAGSDSEELNNDEDNDDEDDEEYEVSDADLGHYISKKATAPRRIFIGKRNYNSFDDYVDYQKRDSRSRQNRYLNGKRNGQIHRIFIGKRGDIKRIFIG